MHLDFFTLLIGLGALVEGSSTPAGPVAYQVARLPMGWVIMVVAGGLSGLLGIGSGALKVPAMDQGMRLPFDPALAAPVILGAAVGAMLGTRAVIGARPAALRKVFVVVLLALGCQMIYHGVTGAFARG